MRAASTLTAIGTALWLAATAANAVGFGRITNITQLGQPLNFAAAVRLEADEVLPRECVSAEVQSGDNKLQPGQVRVTLEGASDSLERSVRVTTSAPIDEPVVTVSVTVGCGAKVTRRFVAFVDPPLINMAQAASVEALPPQRRDSQVAPLIAMVQGEGTPAAAARRGERPGAARNRVRAPVPITVGQAADAAAAPAAARVPRPRSAALPSRQAVASRNAGSGPRLQLETAAPVVAVSASAASSPTSATATLDVAEAAAAARPDDAAAQLAKERARIQSLEEGLAKLRADSQATQASLTALQLRLQEAEAGRYANPLVYALAWLSALLALAVAGLWWRQARARQSAQWWSGPAPAPAMSSAPLAAESTVSAPAPLGSPATAADAFAISTVIEEDEPAASGSAATRPAPFAAAAPAPGPNSVLTEPPRELSVEELIDLEQQVEFFIVLGQDHAAIELLMSHVRSDGGISPLPYLKLLEIYRRRGEHDAYQRIRDRFNRRFNAYAPDWEADLQHGRSLVDYPDTIAQLQQLWASPARAMETLDASLFRRNKIDETFDLPAYRELLFLYSVARDLAEHAGVLPDTSVDLLLPLGDPGEEPIARLSANTQSGEFQNSDMMTMPLDLDVSFGSGTTQPVGTVQAALRRSNDSRFLDFDLDLPAETVKSSKTGGNR